MGIQNNMADIKEDQTKENEIGIMSYFFFVNSQLQVFLSMRVLFALRKNDVSLKVLDWIT